VTYGRHVVLGSNNVYLLASGHRVLGLIKTGPKRLFVVQGQNQGLVEINPLCVLDFYVHESMQRRGFGRELFDHVLKDLNIPAVKLAIDRPSEKFVNFLAKYYNMRAQIPQVNNFAVFHGFFNSSTRPSSGVYERRGTQLNLRQDSHRNSSGRSSQLTNSRCNTPSKGRSHSEYGGQSAHQNQLTWKPTRADSFNQIPPTPPVASNKLPPMLQSPDISTPPHSTSLKKPPLPPVNTINPNLDHSHHGQHSETSDPSHYANYTDTISGITGNSIGMNSNRGTDPLLDTSNNTYQQVSMNHGDVNEQYHKAITGTESLTGPKSVNSVLTQANYSTVPYYGKGDLRSSNVTPHPSSDSPLQRTLSGSTRGKKQFPQQSRNAVPSSFNIFGTMPMSATNTLSNQSNSLANRSPLHQGGNRTAMRTRLW